MEQRYLRFCVLSILLAAALVRLCALGGNPAGVFHDEAEKGYSAFCLLRVGGTLEFTRLTENAQGLSVPTLHPWPLFVDVWGSLTSMIYQYAALPFVALMGLDAWSVRLPAALIGTLTVLLTFFLARSLTGQTSVALWAMTLMAFSPWHVVFSRWAQQGIFVPFFVTCGLLAFLRIQDDKSRRVAGFLIVSAACFGLGFYSYSGAQPFLLLFLPVTALVWRREIARRRRASLAAFLVLAILMAPTLHATFGAGGAGMGRFRRLSVFRPASPSGSGDKHAQQAATLSFARKYVSHFSPQFLFLTGDRLDRHGLRGFGEMLHFEFVFLIAGIYTALKRRSKSDQFLLGWFLLFPISAALTNEGIPHALRTLHAVPCPQILSAMGAVEILRWMRQRWGRAAKVTALALCGANVAVFLVALFLYYPHYSALDFEYGVREAVAMAKENGAANRTPDYRLYVPASAGVPLVPELFYFHDCTPPQQLASQGMGSASIQFLARGPYPLRLDEVAGLLRPGDSLLMSPLAVQAALNRGEKPDPSIRVRPILWRPRPFSRASVPIYYVLSR